MTCKYCESPADESGICESCRAKLGITPGDAVRRRAPCAKCNHPELVRALARELSTSPGEIGKREAVPMAVTYSPNIRFGFFGDAKGTEGLQPDTATGVLELYVCRRCGFTEWYCREPANIPIGAEYGTELISAFDDDGKPYR